GARCGEELKRLAALLALAACAPKPTEPLRLWFGGDVHLGRQVRLAALLALAACAPKPTEPLRLWFGGDVHLGRQVQLAALPFRVAGVVNLEGPISDADTDAQRLLNGPHAPEALAALRVRVAWVENNHADDEGPQGRARTVAALEAAGIAPAGTARLGRVAFVGADLT